MKRTLLLVSALVLAAAPTWAAPATSTDDGAAVQPAATLADDGGGCVLPDLAGLSDDEVAAASLASGLEIPAATPAAVPVCPTTFRCNSITNCAAGPLCGITDIGQCCSMAGLIRCCVSGTIKVKTCPCQCTAPLCAFSCVNSAEVTSRCS